MEVNSASASTAASAAASAGKSLANNFDTFLTLLTTQLEHQDPLEPMDSSEFTQQLVQFSSVEQAIATNKNLESLIQAQQATQTTNSVGYLGKEIQVSGDTTALSDGSATWEYYLPQEAAATAIIVSDINGKVVYSGTGETAAGEHTFTWDGKDNIGNQLDDGLYSIQVAPVNGEAEAQQAYTFVTGIVDGIDTTGVEPMLIVGDLATSLSQVIRVNDPAPSGGSEE
jgi:flagellar basal-body rod modification protein FlgD